MESYENNSKKIYESKEHFQKLNVTKEKVDNIHDKLRMGIDEEIKETVAVLRAMNFPTSSSCAGHIEKNKHSPPYVEIYAKAPEGWKEDKMKQTLWKDENLKYRSRLLPLLEEFYQTRKVSFDAHLQLSNIGIFGGFRLEAIGTHMKAEELGVKTPEETFDKIRLYQKEMHSFTNFLKEKFLK